MVEKSRTLPRPKVRVAFAAIERCEELGRRWKARRKRLAFWTLRRSPCWPTGPASSLACGAKRIWEEQRQHLPGADGVLGIFPAWQHLSDLSKTLSDNEADIAVWTDRARSTLLTSGWPGIEQLLGQDAESRSGSRQTAVEGLRNDLSNHHQHLHDAQRRARGQGIGSGQVEGGCKNLIGPRLKQTGARWRVRRVNRLAGLCSLMDSHPWKTYRQTA